MAKNKKAQFVIPVFVGKSGNKKPDRIDAIASQTAFFILFFILGAIAYLIANVSGRLDLFKNLIDNFLQSGNTEIRGIILPLIPIALGIIFGFLTPLENN